MQQAVDERGARDLDVVGEGEAPLEGAPGDAAIEEVLVLFRLRQLAGDLQLVVLADDGEVVFAEAGNRHGDAIGLFAGPLDVVRRIGKRGFIDAGRGIHQARQTVESDAGTEQGGKVERTHGMSSNEQHC